MRSRRSIPYLAACAALVSFAPAIDLRADASSSITIRSYNTFTGAPTDLATARDVARHAFQHAGIDAGWRECRTAHRAEADACNDVLGSGEVIVRIVAAPAGGGADDVLGDAHLDTAEGGGVLATVFADRVHRTAARTRGDAAILLGRAVAHEVGHLLIGSSRHSRRGLMRAWWIDSELRRNLDYDWQFSPRQGARLRAAVLARRRPQTLIARPIDAFLVP
jgi:hypothetical protein